MLVSCMVGGLGNRLKSFASALRLSTTATLDWSSDLDHQNHVNSKANVEPFEDLFDPTTHHFLGTPKARVNYYGWRWYLEPDEQEEMRKDHGDGSADFKYHGMPPRAKAFYGHVFNELLRPSQRVWDLAGPALERITPDTYGVMARTYWANPGRKSSLSTELVDSFLHGNAFFSTDDPDLHARYLGRDRVVMVPRPADKFIYSGWDYALAELICLARTRKLVLTRHSTFSELALAFSNFNKPVSFLERV